MFDPVAVIAAAVGEKRASYHHGDFLAAMSVIESAKSAWAKVSMRSPDAKSEKKKKPAPAKKTKGGLHFVSHDTGVDSELGEEEEETDTDLDGFVAPDDSSDEEEEESEDEVAEAIKEAEEFVGVVQGRRSDRMGEDDLPDEDMANIFLWLLACNNIKQKPSNGAMHTAIGLLEEAGLYDAIAPLSDEEDIAKVAEEKYKAFLSDANAAARVFYAVNKGTCLDRLKLAAFASHPASISPSAFSRFMRTRVDPVALVRDPFDSLVQTLTQTVFGVSIGGEDDDDDFDPRAKYHPRDEGEDEAPPEKRARKGAAKPAARKADPIGDPAAKRPKKEEPKEPPKQPAKSKKAKFVPTDMSVPEQAAVINKFLDSFKAGGAAGESNQKKIVSLMAGAAAQIAEAVPLFSRLMDPLRTPEKTKLIPGPDGEAGSYSFTIGGSMVVVAGPLAQLIYSMNKASRISSVIFRASKGGNVPADRMLKAVIDAVDTASKVMHMSKEEMASLINLSTIMQDRT